jgi:hypothetical protein
MRRLLTARGFERVEAAWNPTTGRWRLEVTKKPELPTSAQIRQILEKMVEQLRYQDKRWPIERYQINGDIDVTAAEGRLVTAFSLSNR